jgi:hypothetical protein
MTALIIGLSVVFGLIVAFYNALVFKHYFTREQIFNEYVHWLGGGLRLFWMIAIASMCWYAKFYWGDMAFYILINSNLAWTVFDLVYNLIHKKNWAYSGSFSSNTSSLIDNFFDKCDEFLKGGLLLITIAWKPFFLDEVIEDTILNRGWDLVITIAIILVFGYLAYRFFNKKDDK